MGPVKFDDLPKAANELLNDDYQIGYQMKAKQKSNWDGATLTSTVDVWPPKEAAKITWKFPSPFGLAGVSLDKVELDKKGMLKLEASYDKKLHRVPDLKIETKSDAIDPMNATVRPTLGGVTTAFTYTGIKDTQIKCDAKALAEKPSLVLELTHSMRKTVFGVKWGLASPTKPDLGVRHEHGPLFMSFLAKEGLSVFNVHGHYKYSDDIKLACTYQSGGKLSGNFAFGLAYAIKKGTSLKVKLMKDMAVQAGLKHEVAKGFTVLAGCKYDSKSGKSSYGVQLSIE